MEEDVKSVIRKASIVAWREVKTVKDITKNI